MHVTFRVGEVINGWTIKSTMGCSRFIATNNGIIICFDTDAGEGKNYSKILWYTDEKTGRQYRAMRYLIKYVSVVQGLSNSLYQKYIKENG